MIPPRRPVGRTGAAPVVATDACLPTCSVQSGSDLPRSLLRQQLSGGEQTTASVKAASCRARQRTDRVGVSEWSLQAVTGNRRASALAPLGGVHGVVGFPDHLLAGSCGIGAALHEADPDAQVQRDRGLLEDQRVAEGIA